MDIKFLVENAQINLALAEAELCEANNMAALTRALQHIREALKALGLKRTIGTEANLNSERERAEA
ncbi:hypothetical protein SAMN06265338_12117 [Rhodoblastus acidophilus]|uniref:Uncharacterized protein n=1 Tax=Rhodoblastus acidophilus TaxID=1074 RepID=A0A212SAJ9_RHOAC|nr:hypothetical protein [Rhodoblastus acidophilus]PPQ35765.1 hypothetical protein CKO16_19765 [Rhodoblastus acidophilus]RAI19995.1 hypothetical protein CH337_10845 [Rhodoblastus acidophilus]SNB82567.1 hypothetical protein SAMN06265338_12117 [Rhodoblastus acidophilus]